MSSARKELLDRIERDALTAAAGRIEALPIYYFGLREDRLTIDRAAVLDALSAEGEQ